jgi:long-chain fatty acid transport protein
VRLSAVLARLPLLVALVALVDASATGARAAGYAINDQGARSLSRGLAVPATLDGTETLFFNPAGMAELEGWNLAGGVTAIRLGIESTPAGSGVTSESSRDHFEIPHLYASRSLGGRWSVGASVNAPYGLATEWPKDFEGRFVSRIADLKTIQAAALAAVKLPRGWSVGFGPTWTSGDVRLVRDVDLSIFRRGHSAEADLTGDGAAWGWRAGARWRGAKGWSFGMAWHGQATLTFRGDVDYTVVPLGAFSLDQAIATLFVDGPASTSLTLPATGWIGAGRVSPNGRWSWEIAATWTDWSVMDEVIVDLVPIEAGGTQLVINEFLSPQWHDAWAFRAGGRHALGAKWSLDAGFSLDESPVPVKTADPLLPDSDRVMLCLGATRQSERLALDFGVQVLRFETLDTAGSGNTFPSEYESSVVALSATVSWRFGARER